MCVSYSSNLLLLCATVPLSAASCRVSVPLLSMPYIHLNNSHLLPLCPLCSILLLFSAALCYCSYLLLSPALCPPTVCL